MTAEAGYMRWRVDYTGYAARVHVHSYAAVSKQGRYWTAHAKYTAVHGNDHWETVPGPFPVTRRQAMANAEAQDAEIVRRQRHHGADT